jgi:periplasmic protein TonB
MAAIMSTPQLQLPWESTGKEDRLFRAVLCSTLVIFGVFAIAIPLLPVSELPREKLEEVPPQLARIILEKKALPEPLKPLPAAPVEKKPEAPKPVEKARQKPAEKIRPVDPLQQARNVAAASGLLEFQDELSEMRDSVDVDTLNQAQLSRGQEVAASTERTIITSGARAGSGGINTSALSRDTGGAALSGRETTRVQSAIAGKVKDIGRGASAKQGGRADESIRRVMDSNKAAIFSIYNRVLRKDPALQGRLVFEMVIDPSGNVVQITLVSSELADAELTSKILSRIRMINFGSEDVSATRVHYSFDFLPYT